MQHQQDPSLQGHLQTASPVNIDFIVDDKENILKIARVMMIPSTPTWLRSMYCGKLPTRCRTWSQLEPPAWSRVVKGNERYMNDLRYARFYLQFQVHDGQPHNPSIRDSGVISKSGLFGICTLTWKRNRKLNSSINNLFRKRAGTLSPKMLN